MAVVLTADLSGGDGKVAKSGMRLKMVYTGRLASNNKVFDSCSKASPFSFQLGMGEVIKGVFVSASELTARMGCWHCRHACRGQAPYQYPSTGELRWQSLALSIFLLSLLHSCKHSRAHGRWAMGRVAHPPPSPPTQSWSSMSSCSRRNEDWCLFN